MKARNEEERKRWNEKARRARLERPKVREIFRERMEREGKLDAFVNRVLELKGQGQGQSAHMAAMKEFGYVTACRERRMHAEALKAGRLNRVQKKLSDQQKTYKKKKQVGELQKAFDALPNSAPVDLEIAWVNSHPLLFDVLLGGMDEGEIAPATTVTADKAAKRAKRLKKLTVKDIGRKDADGTIIEEPSNGIAPSKGAVTKLLFAMRDPDAWHKRVMDDQSRKKATSGPGANQTGHVHDDLSSIEQMIATSGEPSTDG